MCKQIKIVIVLILVLATANLIMAPKVYGIQMISNMIDAGDSFLGDGADNAIKEENLAEVSRNIYYTFLAIAIAIAVIVGAYLGIKIMVATVEEKAKIKEMLIPYVVGVVVIFSVFFIWSTVVKIGTSVVGDGKETVSSETTATINTDGTKVYSSPDESSEVIITLNSGKIVKIIGTNNLYYKISCTAKLQGNSETFTGYVRHNYITINNY